MTGKRPIHDRRSRLFRAIVQIHLMVMMLFCLPGWSHAATTVDIHTIQTDLPNSPYLNQSVTTTGIVIAVLSDGFYIENPQSSWDSDTCTAEGIYVYTPTGVPSNAVLQNSLTVTGLVQASNSSSYAGTEIYIASPSSTNIVTVSTGNTLPTAVSSSVLTAATSGTCSLYTAGSFGQWLPFEGMRVNVPSSSSLLVTQGTGGTVTASSQTAKTNGQFWAVFTTDTSASARPFRATGISELETVPSTAPSTVERWSGNPQLLLVDTTTLGGTAIDASAGQLYTGSDNLVGIIDYHVSTLGYTGLLLTAASVSSLTKGNTVTATAASARSSGQITVANQNLNSLTAVETNRIAKLANAIVNYEHSPDILALQSVTSAALTMLESAVASAGGPAYSDLSTPSTADSSGYVNAFLVNTSKFDNPAVSQELASATYVTTSSTTATLFDRAPLVLTAGIPRTGTTDYNIVVANTSLLDRTNIDDATLGPDIRNRREQQAQALATVFETYEADGVHLFAAGGYNSFEFSDGYVDALGIIDGSEATNTSSGTIVTLYDSGYNTTTLENTTTTATNLSTSATNSATSRYAYVESGSAEQPDHILISTEMAPLVAIDYARFGADFPVVDTYDSSTVNRGSDHDGVVAYLTVPYPSSLALTSSLNPSYYGNSITFTASVTSAGGTPTGTVTFYDGATELGAETLDSSGVATYATSTLTIGTHTIKASYGGSAAFDTSSATLSQIVDVDITTLILTSSVNPSYYGASVTFTATASSSDVTPTGTVTFYDLTTSAKLGTGTLSSGAATLSISTLTVGTHVIKAAYSGDASNGAATSNTVSQVVMTTYSTTSTLTCSPNPASYGATVTCTDVVAAGSGTPSGTVTFYDGTSTFGTGTLSSGIATYSTRTLAVGSHTITAGYAGLNAYVTSTSNSVTEIIISTFSLSAAPTSRTVYTGEAASYTMSVTPGSGFALDVTLTCSGAPSDTTCSLTPLTVSSGSGTSKLVVQTTAPSQITTTASYRSKNHAWPLLAGLLLLFVPRQLRRRGGWFIGLLLTVALTAGALSGCCSSSSLSGGTPTGTYTVTVTGTATDGTITLTKTATVTMKVESLF